MNDDDTNEISPAEAAALALGDDWPESKERPRGMLTDKDRQFLWGVLEYAHENTAINRRKVIRERAGNGILDLFYLTMLTDTDRGRVFEEEIEAEAEAGELRTAVAGLIHFLYLEVDDSTGWLEETISHGIHNAEYSEDDDTRHGGLTVDVDIEVNRGRDVSELDRRLRSGQGHTLSPEEIGILVREGLVDPDDLETLEPHSDENPFLGSSPEEDEGEDA